MAETDPPGCPEDLVCLRVEEALVVEQRERLLRRYAREAWRLCGAPADAGVDSGP